MYLFILTPKTAVCIVNGVAKLHKYSTKELKLFGRASSERINNWLIIYKWYPLAKVVIDIYISYKSKSSGFEPIYELYAWFLLWLSNAIKG
jgi:hypothetical protein